jgi:hypothetical protein
MPVQPAIVTLPSERAAPVVTEAGASAEPEAPRPPGSPARRVDSLLSSTLPRSSELWGAESEATNTPLPPLVDVVQARRRCAALRAPQARTVSHASSSLYAALTPRRFVATAAARTAGAWRCASSPACSRCSSGWAPWASACGSWCKSATSPECARPKPSRHAAPAAAACARGAVRRCVRTRRRRPRVTRCGTPRAAPSAPRRAGAGHRRGVRERRHPHLGV